MKVLLLIRSVTTRRGIWSIRNSVMARRLPIPTTSSVTVCLQVMNLTVDGQTVMENRYRYDAVDNILGITNAANPTSLTKLNRAKLGGRSSHTYEYDELNRLIHANGKAKRASYDMVMSLGRMSEPLTKVQKVDSTTTAKSYNFAYKYEDNNHPTAPTQIGNDHYTYDSNGNPTLVTNDSTNTTREM